MLSKPVWQQARRYLASWQGVCVLLLIVIGTAALGYQYQATLRPQLQPLFRRQALSSDQLTRVMAALSATDLRGHELREGELWVPIGKEARYFASLVDAAALPAEFHSHTATALQQGSLFDSERDRERRMKYARERDLAVAIESMTGIEKAMVQYDELTRPGFRSQPILTASVSVLPTDGCHLRSRQIETMRQLVASAKAGLKPEEIVVTDLRSGYAHTGPIDVEAMLPTRQECLEYRREVEAHWESKVRSVLSYVPNVSVTIDAKLQEDVTERWQKVEQIAVSIGIPQSYYRDITKQQEQRPPIERPSVESVRKEVDARVRSAVSLLLSGKNADSPENPISTNASDGQLQPKIVRSSIHVTSFDDVRAATPTTAAESKIARLWHRHRNAWLGVILAGLIVGLATRWRRTPALGASGATLSLEDYRDADITPGSSPAHTEAAEIDPEQLRETLADIVRDDPGGAAEVLHRWIDQAG